MRPTDIKGKYKPSESIETRSTNKNTSNRVSDNDSTVPTNNFSDSLSDYYSTDDDDEDEDERFLDFEEDESFLNFDDHENFFGIEDFLFTDNFSIVEAYLSGYSHRPNTPVSTRSRISDFILFLRTLTSSQIPNAFGLFRDEFTDMDSLDQFTPISTHRTGMLSVEIDRLPRHSYRGQTQKEKRLNESPHKCCICMAELELGEELILLEQCRHRFHSGCLESWLKRSRNCPICRSTVHPPSLVIN